MDIDMANVFAPPKNPKSLLLTSNRTHCNNRLPEDCHYQPESLVKLFLLPNVMVCLINVKAVGYCNLYATSCINLSSVFCSALGRNKEKSLVWLISINVLPKYTLDPSKNILLSLHTADGIARLFIPF